MSMIEFIRANINTIHLEDIDRWTYFVILSSTNREGNAFVRGKLTYATEEMAIKTAKAHTQEKVRSFMPDSSEIFDLGLPKEKD